MFGMENPQKSDGFSFFMVVAIITAIALIAGGGLLWVEHTNQKKLAELASEKEHQREELSKKRASEMQLSTSSVVDTSTWKTYHN